MSFFCILSINITKAISISIRKILALNAGKRKEVMNQSPEIRFSGKNGGDGREDPIPIV